MVKVALGADLWYNKPMNVVAPALLAIAQGMSQFCLGELTMDSLYLFPPDDNPQKRCTGPCGRTLPATPEIFGYDKRVKDGLQACCKECKNAKRRKPPVVSDVPEGYRRCTGPCQRVLPATTEFFYARKTRDGLNKQCQECVKQRVNNHYQEPRVREARLEHRSQPEVQSREREWQSQYYRRPEVRTKRRQHNRRYYHQPDNRKRILEYSRQPEVQARHRVYEMRRLQKPGARARKSEQERIYRNTPEGKAKRRVHFANHRARKRSVKGTYTLAQIQEQLKRQRYRCYYAACGHAKFEKRNGKYIYHIEHTFPLNRVVGTGMPANDIGYLVLACPHCNTTKGSRFPWEWPEGGRLL